MAIQEALNPEQQPAHEPLSDDYFYDFINFVGNHEAKLATIAVVSSQPQRWFGGREVRQEIGNGQDQFDRWIPDAKTISRYFQFDFEPAGLVTTRRGLDERGRIFDEYRVEPSEVPTILSFCGLGMRWSLDNPEISVQTLGVTRSEGKFRSPQIRYQIFKNIIENSNEASPKDIIEALVADGLDVPSRIEKHLRLLSAKGIITTERRNGSFISSTGIAISDKYQEPLFDLCLSLDAFQSTPLDETAIKDALAIITEPEACAVLMNKAQEFSTQHPE